MCINSSSRTNAKSPTWCSSIVTCRSLHPFPTSLSYLRERLPPLRRLGRCSSGRHTLNALIREACVTHATLTPSSIVASPEPQTTAETWDLFERYNVATRGRNDVPPRFLKNAEWRDHQGRLGYYAESTLSPRAIVPVEFNEPHLCWVELRWRAREDQWQAFRKAPEDLGLEIPITELTAQEVIQILGPGTPETTADNYRSDHPERTPDTTPMHDSSASENLEPTHMNAEETPDERNLRDQAESLHIFDQGVQNFVDAPHVFADRRDNDIHVFATRTEESRTQTAHINPDTGHIIDPDEAAAHRAAGPDRADPPEGGGG